MYVSLALAIVAQPSGVVLVDEIENGFYYKALRPLLTSLYALAVEHEVQLFASCHSYEFLEAIADVMEPNAKEFALLRVSRENATSEITMVSGNPAIQAIERTFEVR